MKISDYEPNEINYDVKRNKLFIEKKGRYNKYTFEPIQVEIKPKRSEIVDILNDELNKPIKSENKKINKINSSGLIIILYVSLLLVLPN